MREIGQKVLDINALDGSRCSSFSLISQIVLIQGLQSDGIISTNGRKPQINIEISGGSRIFEGGRTWTVQVLDNCLLHCSFCTDTPSSLISSM